MQSSHAEGAPAPVRDEEEIFRLAQVVRSTRDAVLSKDLEGVITSWNPGAVRLYGYGEAEAVGSHISLLIPADRKNEEQEILARVRRGEDSAFEILAERYRSRLLSELNSLVLL